MNWGWEVKGHVEKIIDRYNAGIDYRTRMVDADDGMYSKSTSVHDVVTMSGQHSNITYVQKVVASSCVQQVRILAYTCTF